MGKIFLRIVKNFRIRNHEFYEKYIVYFIVLFDLTYDGRNLSPVFVAIRNSIGPISFVL